jgi:hypothetical protein
MEHRLAPQGTAAFSAMSTLAAPAEPRAAIYRRAAQRTRRRISNASTPLGVPQVIFARPFQELNLRDQHRLQPPTVPHLRCGQRDFQPAEFLEHLLPHDCQVAGA